jgi:hypothetical protein
MSCDSSCGPLVVTLLTGVPGLQGPAGPQGPQGPPGAFTSVSGDITLTTGESGSIATVVGIQSKPVASTTPTAGQVFQFNGTSWVPATYTAGTY